MGEPQPNPMPWRPYIREPQPTTGRAVQPSLAPPVCPPPATLCTYQCWLQPPLCCASPFALPAVIPNRVRRVTVPDYALAPCLPAILFAGHIAHHSVLRNSMLESGNYNFVFTPRKTLRRELLRTIIQPTNQPTSACVRRPKTVPPVSHTKSDCTATHTHSLTKQTRLSAGIINESTKKTRSINRHHVIISQARKQTHPRGIYARCKKKGARQRKFLERCSKKKNPEDEEIIIMWASQKL